MASIADDCDEGEIILLSDHLGAGGDSVVRIPTCDPDFLVTICSDRRRVFNNTPTVEPSVYC